MEAIDQNTGSKKIIISPFQDKNNPDTYIEWEKKVELVFYYHKYLNENKVTLVAIAFTNYAIAWWGQLVLARRRNNELPISNWEDIKVVMRRRFVPSHYYRDIHMKLQSLKYGSKSLVEYHTSEVAKS